MTITATTIPDVPTPPVEPHGNGVVLLLGIPEVARLLGVSEKTCRRLDQAGQLPTPIRLGRLLKWRREELEDWINVGCPPRGEWTWRPGQG